jgi:hypothetical protein
LILPWQGYVFLDVRTPDEHNENAKRGFTNLPIAFESPKGKHVDAEHSNSTATMVS